MISFTEVASNKISEIVSTADDCKGLRIKAMRLGRYTFRYALQLVTADDVQEDDVQGQQSGFDTFLDPESAELLAGTTVDYVIDGDREGFQFNNPAAEPKWDDPLAAKVQKVIDGRVGPALAQHGGWIELSEVKDAVAYVQLGGGCQGCASAHVTLNDGIKKVILEDVPEIKDVVDCTDHSSGSQPYH